MTSLPTARSVVIGVRPGDALLHPVAIGSVLLLVVNDHVLKAGMPGWWTGKLSDVAGLVVLAVVLMSVVELAGAPIARRTLVWSLAASGLALVTIKVVPVGGDLYQWGLGIAQWAAGNLAAVTIGTAAPPLAPVQLVRDASDLVALPALVVAWLALRHRSPT